MDGIVEAGIKALSVFGAQSQHNRLIRMDLPREDGPRATMLVNKVHMREELSRDFRIEAEVLSDDVHITLKSMMARMVTISLVREDGSLRYMNGYVSSFRFVKTDGGFAYYQMVLEPWLAFAKLRKDNVSFHYRSVLELTEATFANYRQRDWRTRMSLEYADKKLTVANQHNETDYNHLHRRWEDAGLYYSYEHRADGHTLVLSDSSLQADAIDAAHVSGADDAMHFRAQVGPQDGDGIRDWQATRQLGSSKLSLASFDYESPLPQVASADSLNLQGDASDDYELYENAGAYAYSDRDEGDALARRRLEGRERNTQYFEASGNDRAAQPGRLFTLAGHFSAEERRPTPGDRPKPSIASRNYLIVSVEHTASNNYPAGRDGKSEYNNTLTCIRGDFPWRPGRRHNSEACVNPGVQTALVVGPAGEDIYTDDLGRVKLQFHWDRIGTFDQASSPWIRVMMPMAGANLGQMCLPRIGQEVVVQFMDGNIDRPIVVGVVYNRQNMPPWHLPGQQALSGLRSRELKSANGGQSNHLILDDTKDAMQVQLKSDHQCSQLSLGSITRIENAQGRMDARGEGWELTTNAWGVMRAGKGMLITTECRPNAASHATSMQETLNRLVAASDRHKSLAEEAKQYKAQEGQGQQAAAASAIDSQNADIEGDGAGEGCSEFKDPHLLIASPAGIETTSARSTHIASEEHTALTTGRSLSLAAGDSLFASIGETFRLFVRKAGMKLVAASGKVSIRAKDDDIEAVAKKVLSLISESDWVEIRGRKGVRLHGASSMIEISEKVQFFTPSPTIFHGNLETLSPRNRPQPPEEEASEPKQGELHSSIRRHGTGAPLADVPYEVLKGGVKIKEGLTDRLGRIVIPHEDGTPNYKISLANGEDFLLDVSDRFEEQEDGEQSEEALSNQGFRAMDDTTDGRQHD